MKNRTKALIIFFILYFAIVGYWWMEGNRNQAKYDAEQHHLLQIEAQQFKDN